MALLGSAREFHIFNRLSQLFSVRSFIDLSRVRKRQGAAWECGNGYSVAGSGIGDQGSETETEAESELNLILSWEPPLGGLAEPV